MFKVLQFYKILFIINFEIDIVKFLEKLQKIFKGFCEKYEERNIELICDFY